MRHREEPEFRKGLRGDTVLQFEGEVFPQRLMWQRLGYQSVGLQDHRIQAPEWIQKWMHYGNEEVGPGWVMEMRGVSGCVMEIWRRGLVGLW